MITKKAAKILIVDDHPLMRTGLRQLISDEPDFSVCGEADSVREAMQLLADTSPDAAIVDLSLPDGSGLDLIKRIHARNSATRILVVSMYDELLFSERSLRAGAMGYISKQEAPSKVIDALRQVLDGKVYLSPQMTERMLRGVTGTKPKKANESQLDSLSDRELEVFGLIGRGLSTAEIAGKLNLSIKTIETHRANIKKKLHLNTSNELILQAMHWSIEQQ